MYISWIHEFIHNLNSLIMGRWPKRNDSGAGSQNQASAQGQTGRWHGQAGGGTAEEKAFDLFAEMMINKIENAKGDWKKPWFSTEMPWPKALYGKQYNGMNALMLTFLSEARGYQLPIFATHERIFSLNFDKDEKGERVPLVDKESGEKLPFVHVLKGEQSFPVFLSQTNIVHKDTKEKISYADYVKLPADEQENYKVYHNNKVYLVFNVDQTNLKEARPEMYQKLVDENLPKKPEVAEGEKFSFEPLDQMVEGKQPWLCPIETNSGQKACYNSGTNKISVPEKALFEQGEEFYGTLLHEMAHSTGHESVLNRLKPAAFGSPEYAREELVAEMSAALSCHRYGISKTPDSRIEENSALYLKDWLSALKEDPKYIKTVLSDVRAATGRINVMVDNALEVINKESAKLDLRDDDDNTIQYDEDGNAINVDDGHYAADKKQGEDEGNGKKEESHEEHRPHRGR